MSEHEFKRDIIGGLAGRRKAVRKEVKRRLIGVQEKYPGRLFDALVELLTDTDVTWRLEWTAESLRDYQKWRRGEPPFDGDTPETHKGCPLSPYMLGRAEDIAIATLEAVARFRDDNVAERRFLMYGPEWRKDAMGMEKEQLVNMIADIGTRYHAEFEDSCKEMGRMMALMRRLKGAVETAIGIYRNETVAQRAVDRAARGRLIESHTKLVALAKRALGETDDTDEGERKDGQDPK